MLTRADLRTVARGVPEWRLEKPELCISVRSQDPRWGYAVGHLAAQRSGECPFCYGDTLNFNERISEEAR